MDEHEHEYARARRRARVLITQVYFFLAAKERKGNYRKEDRERAIKGVLIHFCAPF